MAALTPTIAVRVAARTHAALAVALLLSALATPATAQAQPTREAYAGLDAYIEAARKAWKVPGVQVAIVRNDSLVYARGFGQRDVTKPAPVTPQTIFAIGSSSKAFTAAAVAMLVDEKKVSLDAPASTYLPGLQMADPYVTRELTVRDLLSHRSGLARGELSWYASGFDRDEIVRRVRFLQPSWSFRSQFGYQNIMYIAAGQVVAKVGKTTWDDFVRERIFRPLGMAASTTSMRAVDMAGDVAMPHAETNDSVYVVPWRDIDNAGPAGSINSNVVDMAQWVRLQLGRGRYAGTQLISPRMADEMHTAHTVIRTDSAARTNNPDTHLQAYGLGWFLEDYRGRLAVHHGGNVDGFTALVGMLPEEKVGVVILTNMNGTALPNALMHRVFDQHLGGTVKDWSGEALARTQASRKRAAAAQATADARRVRDTRPTLPLASYAGTYADSLHGEMIVREENGKLALSFGPNLRGTLEHWNYDTFRTRLNTPVLPPVTMTFRLNAAGRVDELHADLVGPVVFRRRPDPTPATPPTTPPLTPPTPATAPRTTPPTTPPTTPAARPSTTPATPPPASP